MPPAACSPDDKNSQPTQTYANDVGHHVVYVEATVWQQPLYAFGQQADAHSHKPCGPPFSTEQVHQKQCARDKYRRMYQMVGTQSEDVIVKRDAHPVEWCPHEESYYGEIPWPELPASAMSEPSHRKVPQTVPFLHSHQSGQYVIALCLFAAGAIVATHRAVVVIDRYNPVQ